MDSNRVFNSVLAAYLKGYIAEKESLCQSTESSYWCLHEFDKYLIEIGHAGLNISKRTYDGWLEWASINRKKSTIHCKVLILTSFMKYMCSMGNDCYVPPPHKNHASDFVPYIFSDEEIGRIFEASDNLALAYYTGHNTVLFSMPALVRFLYSTGVRISEALAIRNKDVNFDKRQILIEGLKNKMQRLAPINQSLEKVLKQYLQYRNMLPVPGIDEPEGFMFVSGLGRQIKRNTVSKWFKKIILAADIPYNGQQEGPRIHDLRHTACVHAMSRLVSKGYDIYCALPMLARYMGHKNPTSTESYVRLTQSMYPDVLLAIP